jgi:hypothetical protein
MAQRGRKSSLNVVTLDVSTTRSRLTAPSVLTKAEAKFFVEAAAANPHLRPADAPLLAAYAQAMVKTYRMARQSDTASWEKSARVAMALATKLRITAQAQVHPESAGRKRPHSPPSYYETETMEPDDERR